MVQRSMEVETAPVRVRLPLQSLRRAFELLGQGPRPVGLDGRRFEGLPDRQVPLAEVREWMLQRRVPTAARDAVWGHLVRRARQYGDTWTVACAGMALPALTGTSRWLVARYPGDPFDMQAEVVAGFLSGLAAVDLARPHVLPRLRWAAYRQGLAALNSALDSPVPVTRFGAPVPHVPSGHPDLVLAQAVRHGVLTQIEKDLIGVTRLEGVPPADWAELHGMTTAAVYKARRRAECRLTAYLREEAATEGPGVDPVAALALAAVSVRGDEGRVRPALLKSGSGGVQGRAGSRP
jgi:hypothetical protein